MSTHLPLLLLFITSAAYSYTHTTQAHCKTGCKLAYASYLITQNSNLTYISTIFSQPISNILKHNPSTIIPTKDFLQLGSKIHIPFSCECLNFDFLGHTFPYTVQPGDTFHNIANFVFANLTTEDWIQRVNYYDPHDLVDGLVINVTVNCSCGDASVSKDYGLFVTYPISDGENVSSVAVQFDLPERLLNDFNPGFNGSGRLFVPAKDIHGKYPPLMTGKGISKMEVAGISSAVITGIIFVAVCLYAGIYKNKSLRSKAVNEHIHRVNGSELPLDNGAPSPGITVENSVEFSYEELAEATDDFNIAYKIGQGGFGQVFYAELRGEKAAIKKMDTQASKEFLSELKVLTHVHHLNLVRLIGYCIEGSLFLVYEYIENGDLGHHLRSSGKNTPLSWSARVQIALDSARGLEYIHEHTVPVYIHRDIKTANILIDENFRGKVADFGLTKLTEVGSSSLQTRLVGTFGYMSPEYAQYGDVSPKIDVYAFGVVLYELISAKEAIVRTSTESKGLVSLFEEALSKADQKEGLSRLVDAKLGNNYPLDSIYKMAQLAKACTQENPQLRPSMRSIVVALMTLSSTTEDWDVGSFYENQALVSLMSGR